MLSKEFRGNAEGPAAAATPSALLFQRWGARLEEHERVHGFLLAAARRGLGGVHALQQIHNLARSHQRERERCIRVAAAPGSQRVRAQAWARWDDMLAC